KVSDRVDASVLQQNLDNQPRFAAGAIDAHFLAAKVADVVNLFPRHPYVRHEVVPATECDNVRALRMAWQQASWRACDSMHIARDERLIGRRRAIDSDRLNNETLFVKQSSVVGDEHWKRGGRKQRDGHAH